VNKRSRDTVKLQAESSYGQ